VHDKKNGNIVVFYFSFFLHYFSASVRKQQRMHSLFSLLLTKIVLTCNTNVSYSRVQTYLLNVRQLAKAWLHCTKACYMKARLHCEYKLNMAYGILHNVAYNSVICLSACWTICYISKSVQIHAAVNHCWTMSWVESVQP